MNCMRVILSLALFISVDGMAQNWSVGGNNLNSNGRIGANTDVEIIFETNNAARGRVTRTGLWGFGVTTPAARVHIGTAAGKQALRVDVGGQAKLIVDGTGGTTIGGTTVPPQNGLYVTGPVGIASSPGIYHLKLTHGTYGFDIEHSTSKQHWELYVNGTNGLALFANGALRGQFNATTGAYSAVSDERVKTNIQAMPPVLAQVRQLRPATYQMHQDGLMSDAAVSWGFVAQDVAAVFPHLVQHHYEPERDLDAYTVDYAGFGVLAIKAIQELEARVAELERELAKTR